MTLVWITENIIDHPVNIHAKSESYRDMGISSRMKRREHERENGKQKKNGEKARWRKRAKTADGVRCNADPDTSPVKSLFTEQPK